MSDIWKGVLKGRALDSVEIRSIFYLELAVVAPDTVKDCFAHYFDAILVPIQSWLSPYMVWYSVEMFIQTGAAWDPISEEAYAYNGSGTGDTVANLLTAVLIGKAGGKRHIGRKFISGLVELAIDGDKIVSTALADFALAALGYVSPITTTAGSVIVPGVVDKTNTFRMFQSGWLTSLLGTQRRRKPGMGI